MTFAASRAFFDFSEAFLDRIASRELGINIEGYFADKLFKLVQHVLGCSDDKACSVLETRLRSLERQRTSFDELAQTAECVEAIDEDDESSFKTHLNQIEEQSSHCQALKKQIIHTLAKAMPKPKKHKKTMTDLPDEDDKYTYDAMIGFFPKSIAIRLRKDYFNGRWQVWWRRSQTSPWNTLSRSWGSRNHKECLVDLLRATWEIPVQQGEHCPINNLFPAQFANASECSRSLRIELESTCVQGCWFATVATAFIVISKVAMGWRLAVARIAWGSQG